MAQNQSSKRSEVWKYFKVVESHDGLKPKVKCLLCATELAYSGGSTGTMANHLKFKHKSLKVERSEQTDKPKQVQKSITAFRTPVMSREKWIKCTQKLSLMCARDLRPISLCEGGGFKEFCAELNPSYEVPVATTVSNYVTRAYEHEKGNLSQIIKNQTGVALTSDHWTSLATEGYITVTGHFLDSDWTYQNCVLATRRVLERHTGENTANEIKSIADEFGIKEVSAIVTDNASNMVVCCHHLQWPHVRCFGHTLQLSIRGAFDAIPSISRTIAASKRLVNHFRKSVVASNELKNRQNQMNIPENSLIIDCATRWNSTYDMFERLLQQRLAVYTVLHDPNVTNLCLARSLDLPDEQWQIMQGMVPVLKPLYIATRTMCSEEYPTLSGVYPILFSLVNYHLAVSDADCTAIAPFKRCVKDDLIKRHGLSSLDEVCKETPMTRTFLDPRFRSLPFLSEEQRKIVHENVLAILGTPDDHEGNKGSDPDNTNSNNESDFIPFKRSKLSQDDMAFLLGNYYEDCEVVVPTNAKEELDLYVQEKTISTGENPFKWWKSNQGNYPKLSAVARQLLCIPATSVPSERVFSTAGDTVTKLRASLDTDTVDKLIFLNKRLKVVKSTDTDVPKPCTVQIKQEKDHAAPAETAPPLPALPSLPEF